MPGFSMASMFREARNTVVKTVFLWCLIAPPAIAQSLFATIGDYGDGFADEGNIAGLVYSWNPDFIITMGDNRYGSTDFDKTVGQFYCDSLTEAESGSYCSGSNSPTNAFFPSLGNHDYTDGSGLNEYLNYFTLPGAGVDTSGTSGSERYYDFIRGPVHFFAIDSEGALNSASDKMAQMNWLEAQLAASNAPWQVVYFHHAPYSSATNHGSTTAMQWPFAAWGADAVIAGHDHTYERILADGIVYFVNGLGGHSIGNYTTPVSGPVSGSRVRYNGDYGAMRVDASDIAITFEFINVSGSIIDTYTIEAGATPSTEETVDLTGTVEDAGGTPHCALVLASGQFMFTCNPNGPYSLLDLPTENDGTVKRQVYVDGFFPSVETLTGSVDETVVMTRAGNCPDYNSFPEPGVSPDSAGKRINVSGTVLLQNTQTPVCAMALANGQFGFTCDGTGTYSANIPLDNNGQYKLQVYAEGFAPMVQAFDEFSPDNDVRLARAAECQ